MKALCYVYSAVYSVVYKVVYTAVYSVVYSAVYSAVVFDETISDGSTWSKNNTPIIRIDE